MKKVLICVENHIGSVREENEDNFFCGGMYRKDLSKPNMTYQCAFSAEEPVMMAVLDGMGGLRDGSTASYMTARYLSSIEPERLFWRDREEAAALMVRLNRNMCRVIDLLSKNMGTTAVLLQLWEGTAQVCNIGDSRAYLFRDRGLRQLSVDHTEESAMREFCRSAGLPSPEHAKKMHHALTQHLGIRESEFLIEPAVSEELALRTGDCFLLCSDGLTNMVTDDEIRAALLEERALQSKAKLLLQLALEAGGKDNITVLLAEVRE